MIANEPSPVRQKHITELNGNGVSPEIENSMVQNTIFVL